MTKLKKSLIFIISTTLIASSMNIMSVDSYQLLDSIKVEGYEQFEDYGMFTPEWNGIEYVDTLAYRDVDDHLRVAELFPPSYNLFTVKVKTADKSEWTEIYNKYKGALDFDVSNEIKYADWTQFIFYDEYNEDGNRTFDISEMPNKYALASEMSRELIEADIVLSVDYTRYSASILYGDFHDYTKLEVHDTDASEAELAAIAKTVDETLTVLRIEDTDGEVYFSIENMDGVDELMLVVDAVASVYPDVNLDAYIDFALSADCVQSTPINLLTAIIEESSCDINQSGAPDLDDAVLVLTSYANTAAGISAASETADMDVNGDGTVDLDDALKIVTVYAEMAAGLR